MGSNSKRRGQTWQSSEWRRFMTVTDDLAERARAAFTKLRQKPAAADEHSCARTPAPYTGDGIAAGGAFVVKPEYRGFP